MTEALHAFAMGISMALHPCGILIQFSAVQLLSRFSTQSQRHHAQSILFILGYFLAILAIGNIILFGLLQSQTLAKGLIYLSQILIGPFLIFIGMFYTQLLTLKNAPTIFSKKWKASSTQNPSSFLLGILLGLSLCPASSLLYLGVFIPKVLDSNHPHLLTIPFSTGPCIILSVIYLTLNMGSKFIQNQQKLSHHTGLITGTLLIASGVYLTIQGIWL